MAVRRVLDVLVQERSRAALLFRRLYAGQHCLLRYLIPLPARRCCA